ncbi:MAG: DNA internalization-related competence protein ComEC/Rec2 [Nitrospirae bacterium]|nr:DNA internalization-related competence protein ComEC/Rec2 [Nitrospirota bacterium]
MIAFTVSFISGIAAFNFFPFFPASIIILCIAISVFLFKRHKDLKKISFIVLIFAFGFLYSFTRQEKVPEINLPEGEAVVEGDVIDVPEWSNNKLRFTIDQVFIDGKPFQGKVRLYIAQDEPVNKAFASYTLPAGEKVRAAAKLRGPNVLHNPGVYSHDLKEDGIIAVGFISRIQGVGKNTGLTAWINRKRQLLGDIIDNSLSHENSALHKAIIPGLTGNINQEIRDAFSVTGLAHILSISGTHFGLLAFIIFKLIKTLTTYLPEKALTRMTLYITPAQISILVTLPLLVLYVLLSGMSAPAVRSFIMIFIYMLALFLGRRDQWLNSLAIAAFIILMYQPKTLFDLSFQLSFIAVLSIGYAAEKKSEDGRQNTESRTMGRARVHLSTDGGICTFLTDKVKTVILMTIAAVAGTAPLVALVFKQFPLISPLSNLVITPLVCFVILPLGFFSAFFALIFQMSSMPLGGLTDVLSRFALTLVKTFSQVPHSNFHIPNPSIVMIVLYFLSLISIINPSVSPLDKGGIKRGWRLLPLALVICIYLITPHFKGKEFKVTFLDVGQGDSSVVQLPDGKTMLIDGGTQEPDTGRSVIAPYLWSKGIRSIDYLVATHLHPDHYGGLIYIMDNFKVGEIWLNSMRTNEAENFFRKMLEKKIPYRVLARGDALEAKGYRIYALHPYKEFFADSARGQFSNQNSGSLVLKLVSDNASILFTADIETEAEENLLHLGKWLKSDIIKAPHHGGNTSSSEKFLKAVNPQTAVMSVGKHNQYNHPHKETLERYGHAGAMIYRTDVNGAVTMTSRDNAGGLPYKIRTYWDNEFRKVSAWRDEISNLRLLLFCL